MDKGLVSIIIATIKGKEHLKECLPSLLSQSYSPCEIIVLDNGSTDGTRDYAKKNFPKVTLIENGENLGFAKANNKGIRISRGEYILVLNDDTNLEPDCIENMVKVMHSDNGIGMCSPKILSYFNHKVIDNVGHLIYKDGLNFSRGRGEIDYRQYDLSEEVCFPPGCAAFYRRQMLDEVGLFDEDFFMFGEDADLGLRGRLAGWRCMYVPNAVLYHKWSSSIGKYSPLKAFLVERNRLWVALKIFPLSLLLLNPFYAGMRYLFQAYSALIKAGYAGNFVMEFSKIKLLKILLSANIEAIKYLPKNIRKRKEIHEFKKVSNSEIWSWFRNFGITARKLAFMDNKNKS